MINIIRVLSKLSFILFISTFLTLGYLFPSFLSSLKGFIPLLLGFVMFGMGMTLNFSQIRNVLLKPQIILITVFLQFTVMPLTAYFLIQIFTIPSEYALGIIILGSCPGGTASNLISYLCKADVALSIMCTLISTLFSVILTPFLILFLTNENINVDVIKLIIKVLVDGVTKLSKFEGRSDKFNQSENFRKLLLATSRDIRVLFVKLADRLDNMRTLRFIKDEKKKKRIYYENLQIY